MKVVVRMLEVTAVLVPDFQTLGLIAPTFFSLYRCAITLGFPGTQNIIADLLISVVLGYAVAVALNLASAVTLLARPNRVPFSHPAVGKAQFVCAGIEARPAPGSDQRYLA
jgi:hypothetical protein